MYLKLCALTLVLWVGTIKGAKSVVRSMNADSRGQGKERKQVKIAKSVVRSMAVDSTGQVKERKGRAVVRRVHAITNNVDFTPKSSVEARLDASDYEARVALSKLVIGFHTSSMERYEQMNAAQFETWAADFPRDRVVVAGGPRDNVGAAPGGPCPDDRDQTCKDAAILHAAAQKLTETGSEWFMGLHEDAYIRLDLLAKALPVIMQDTERPLILTGVGCGQGWQYHAESQNGTLPYPRGWVEPNFACQSVWEHGGLCTGPAYFINRAALLRITTGHGGVKDFLEEYKSHWHGEGSYSKGTDRLLACVLRDNHVAMESLPGGLSWTDVRDINEGWQARDKSVLRESHAIYNVVGSNDADSNDPNGLWQVRGRIPTFLREAHSFLREETDINGDARAEEAVP